MSCLSWANQGFDSSIPIIDEYVTANCGIQSLFFTNSKAKMSSNSGMTQMANAILGHVNVLKNVCRIPVLLYYI